MNAPRTFLLAVTDNEQDRRAARQAIDLAASMGAAIIALSVTPQFEGNMYLTHFQNHLEEIQAPHKRVLCWASSKAAAAGVPCTTQLAIGSPFEVIVDMADAHDADWIVLGEMRRSMLERSILSPLAPRVIGYSRREVLVLQGENPVALGRIMLCLDGSSHGERAMDRALSLARSYAGTILAATVVDVPPEYHVYDHLMSELLEKANAAMDELRQKAAALDVPVECHVRQGDAASALLDIAADAAADFIIMGSHGRTGLRRLLLGGVADEVLHNASIPVLVVP